jgi:hypothetical protein
MPRGSRPGERRGGRQRGTPNKKTLLKNAAIAAAAAKGEVSPLDFLIAVMRDSNTPFDLRIKVAMAALPYVHAKLESSAPGISAERLRQVNDGCSIDIVEARALRDDHKRLTELIQLKPFGQKLSASELEEQATLRDRISARARIMVCPEGYSPKQARLDSDRLHQLHRKLMSSVSCGGGSLSDEESDEEALLTARRAAFEETAEGRGRRRIFELFLTQRSGAEQNELDELQKLYPAEPLDDDEPLRDAIEAWGKVAAGEF